MRQPRSSGSGVSVVVCSRNRPTQLTECLGRLAEVLRPEDELIVVDSASDTGETLAVARAADAAVAVRVEQPGLSRARNAGVRSATRAVVVFTDDDCTPLAGWAAALESEFADAEVGLVTGAVRPHGSGFTSGKTSGQRVVYRYPTAGDQIGHGANMAVRRTLIEQLGGFDETLGAGATMRSADDWDVFFRVLRAGHTVVYTPDSVVLHHQWRSNREALGTRHGYAIGAGALAVKLRRLGGEHDAAQARTIAQRRLSEGFTAIGVGLATLRWFRCAAGLVTVSGYLRGRSLGRRTPVRGQLFVPGPR